MHRSPAPSLDPLCICIRLLLTKVIACSLNSLVKDFHSFFIIIYWQDSLLHPHLLNTHSDTSGRLSDVRLRGCTAVDFALRPGRILTFPVGNIFTGTCWYSKIITWSVISQYVNCHPPVLCTDLTFSELARAYVLNSDMECSFSVDAVLYSLVPRPS